MNSSGDLNLSMCMRHCVRSFKSRVSPPLRCRSQKGEALTSVSSVPEQVHQSGRPHAELPKTFLGLQEGLQVLIRYNFLQQHHMEGL